MSPLETAREQITYIEGRIRNREKDVSSDIEPLRRFRRGLDHALLTCWLLDEAAHTLRELMAAMALGLGTMLYLLVPIVLIQGHVAFASAPWIGGISAVGGLGGLAVLVRCRRQRRVR